MRVPNTSRSPSRPSSRPRLGVALATTFAAVGLVSAMAACGSRTGLFADDTPLLPDGAIPTDARPDDPVDGAVLAARRAAFPYLGIDPDPDPMF